jgi:hypothetical protein
MEPVSTRREPWWQLMHVVRADDFQATLARLLDEPRRIVVVKLEAGLGTGPDRNGSTISRTC